MKKLLNVGLVLALVVVSSVMFAACGNNNGNENGNGNGGQEETTKQGWYFETKSNYGGVDKVILYYGTADETVKEDFSTVIYLKAKDGGYVINRITLRLKDDSAYSLDRLHVNTEIISGDNTYSFSEASMQGPRGSGLVYINCFTGNEFIDITKTLTIKVTGYEAENYSTEKEFVYTIAAGAIKTA
jgi:hypothetical protein